MGYRKWKPSKAKAKEFKQTMDEISVFCQENDICQSSRGDSYYFNVNGKQYRVSNHTVESSNRAAYDDIYGKTRELYHPNGREDDVIYIFASKTRIKEIFNAICNGCQVDGRGRVINN